MSEPIGWRISVPPLLHQRDARRRSLVSVKELAKYLGLDPAFTVRIYTTALKFPEW